MLRESMLYTSIRSCRICGNKNLIEVLNLGTMALTGVFPKPEDSVDAGPLELVKCHPKGAGDVCGLLQLRHNYDLTKLYGDNYGYRSSLNKSMVEHLKNRAQKIKRIVRLRKGDLVVDIGSNDGTLLKSYNDASLRLVGIDPTIAKFSEYYPPHIDQIADFFSAKLLKQLIDKKAMVITSIAMFYDLEKPVNFMKQIKRVLHDDGIWVFEQSYMPRMIDNVSYDTICHEHLEYYTLKQMKWMTDRVGFKIVDIELNDVNGASFCLTVAKKNSYHKEATEKITKILKQETDRRLDDLETYRRFSKNIQQYKKELTAFIKKAKKEGKTIIGYGASTKGSVILQFCKLSKKHIPYIAEVNEYKFGRLAPGTDISIISEEEAHKYKPDYLFVLPWHFKQNIIDREQAYLKRGGQLLFPLPHIEVVQKK